MKTIFRYTILFLSLFFFAGCEEEQKILQDYFVSFDGNTAVGTEGLDDIISFRVKNVGPQSSSDITLQYTVGGTAIEGQDYEIVGGTGSVTIPANESFGSLSIELLDDNVVEEAKTIIFTITSASNGSRVGQGAFQVGSTFTITIADNDCPWDISTFAGDYNVVVLQSTGFGQSATSYTTTLTVDPTQPNTLVDANFFNVPVNGTVGDPGTQNGAIKIEMNEAGLTSNVPSQTLYSIGGGPRIVQPSASLPLGGIQSTCGLFQVTFDIARIVTTDIRNSVVLQYSKR
ncbi:MAG: hypothetical protein OHK0053_12190 [Microscillaceae bacterium]